jgi:hypothetical protein
MALVLREFLQEVVSTASAENEKPALQLLRKVLEILVSENAREFTRRYKVAFADLMPDGDLRASPLRKLGNFGEKELPRVLANKTSVGRARR